MAGPEPEAPEGPSEEVIACRERRQANRRQRMQSVFLGGIFIILLITFLRFTRPVLMPAILALLLTLVVQPVANLLCDRLRLPRALMALLVVLGLTAGTLAGGYYLSGPTTYYIEELRKDSVKSRLGELFEPIQKIHVEITDLADQVTDLSNSVETNEPASPDGDLAPAPLPENPDQRKDEAVTDDAENQKPKRPVAVEIRQSPVGLVYSGLQDFGSYLLSTLVLLFFLLSYGQTMAEKFSRESGGNRALTDIQDDIAGYLFTISIINVALGVSIAFGLWLLGIPNVILWGCMAALLNFIPYAGALIGSIIITLVAALETASVGTATTAGLIYMGLSALEGNILTPSIIGKRFDINPVVIFLWVLSWAAIWGLAGMLISLPLLMGFRILCSRVPSLMKVERLITL